MCHDQYVALKEQVDELASKLEKMTKLRGYQAAAQAKVIENARQYAMMVSFGKYMENGSVISVASSDRTMYASQFADNLKNAAISMMIEDGLTGAENYDN